MCKVTSLRSDPKKKQFIFELSLPMVDNENDDGQIATSPSDSQAKQDPGKKKVGGFLRRDDKRANAAAIAAGGVVAGSVTSGVGLFASMLFLAGSTTNHNHNHTNNSAGMYYNQRQIVLSCESERDAKLWIDALNEQIRELGDSHMGPTPGHTVESTRNEPPPEHRLDEVEEWIKSTKWRVYDVFEGVRIFEQNFSDDSGDSVSIRANEMSNEPPCLRVNVPINGPVNDAYSALMTLPASCRTGIIKSLRVVTSIDNNTDIIHLALDQTYLHPSWTGRFPSHLTSSLLPSSDMIRSLCFSSSSRFLSD
jgi:hypothetical protein